IRSTGSVSYWDLIRRMTARTYVRTSKKSRHTLPAIWVVARRSATRSRRMRLDWPSSRWKWVSLSETSWQSAARRALAPRRDLSSAARSDGRVGEVEADLANPPESGEDSPEPNLMGHSIMEAAGSRRSGCRDVLERSSAAGSIMEAYVGSGPADSP